MTIYNSVGSYKKLSAPPMANAPPQDSTKPPQSKSPLLPPIVKRQPLVPWSTGLCDCLDDVDNCYITCFCPCVTFGRITEIVDKGTINSCLENGAMYTLMFYTMGCCCLYSFLYRSKLRRQYTLDEAPCPDCMAHTFCHQCSLCQEYRELKSHGLDASLGWRENLERQNRGVQMKPPVESGMTR